MRDELKQWFEARFFKITPRNTVLFCFLWLMVGFTIGTETLLGPVIWATTALRDRNAHPEVEQHCVKAIIAAYVIASFIFSAWLTGVTTNTRRWAIRMGIPLLCTVAFAGTLFFWLNPGKFGHGGLTMEPTGNANFTIGPYPTEEQLVELKRRGYTAVVSLLHPAVVPFEPKLMADEKAAAARTGIKLVHAPMLPWISENRESLDAIKALAAGPGRYYIHCYLGRDRVNAAKRIIELAGAEMKHMGPASGARDVQLAQRTTMYHGPVVLVESNVYATPLPNDEEYLSDILAGGVRTVISTIDPTEAWTNKAITEREESVLADHGIMFTNFPLRDAAPDGNVVAQAARAARLAPRPLVIHSFTTPSPALDAVVAAFLADTNTMEQSATSTTSAAAALAANTPLERLAAALPAPLARLLTLGVPSLKMTILLSPFCLAYVVACAAWAGRLRVVHGIRAPFTRKVFHFCIFTMAGVMQLAGGLGAVMIFGTIAASCVLYAIWRGDNFPFYEAMARPTDAPHRTLFIMVPLITTALGGLLSNMFFTAFAPVGYLVGGWGDAIGEPVGSAWGRHRYKVPSLAGVKATRSIEGSTAVLIVGFLAAIACLHFLGFAPWPAFKTALACAVAGMLVEAVSTHGLDNLTIQVAASGVAWWILE